MGTWRGAAPRALGGPVDRARRAVSVRTPGPWCGGRALKDAWAFPMPSRLGEQGGHAACTWGPARHSSCPGWGAASCSPGRSGRSAPFSGDELPSVWRVREPMTVGIAGVCRQRRTENRRCEAGAFAEAEHVVPGGESAHAGSPTGQPSGQSGFQTGTCGPRHSVGLGRQEPAGTEYY